MKSQLSKVLKAAFHHKMKTMLPSLEKAGTDFGGVIYRQREEDGRRYIFVFLYPDPKYDRFTIEFAANSLSTYPFEVLPGDKGGGKALRCRIGRFLGTRMDFWWKLNRSDELEPNFKRYLQDHRDLQGALSKIPDAVQDAIDQIVVALPKFIGSLS